MKKELTCIVCPMSCQITVEMNDAGEILAVTGNTCNRGENYARSEMTHPLRQLTSTVKITGADLSRLPVILSGDIPKERLFDVMKEINKVSVEAPVKVKDVMIANVCGLGVDVIASRSMEQKKL